MPVPCPVCNAPCDPSEGAMACSACGASLLAAVSTMAPRPLRTPTPLPAPGTQDEGLLQPGEILAGYRIERLLGQGGMGAVYVATQVSLNRQVALKVLAPRFAQDPTFVQRFDRESSALANLSHPNIVAVIDRGNDRGRYYFVMELVDGVNLR